MRGFCQISDESERQLYSYLKPCKFAKRQLLVEEGRLSNAAFFIEHGMTRSYWLVDGMQITTSFSTEGAIVFSMDEIYYGKPSEEYVQAVEPLEGYSIDTSDLRHLVSENMEFARWWSAIHQYEYRRLHRSHKERLTLPARERYEAFQAQFPEVCRRALRSHIASYLGITLATLSRLGSKK